MSNKTLKNDEIRTERTLGRRSAIRTIGATALGVGAAVAGATLGAQSHARAQHGDPVGHGQHCSDTDPHDPGGHGSHCTDSDH